MPHDPFDSLPSRKPHPMKKAVFQSRHTWSKPIWVLRGETQIDIVPEIGIEAAIAKPMLEELHYRAFQIEQRFLNGERRVAV